MAGIQIYQFRKIGKRFAACLISQADTTQRAQNSFYIRPAAVIHVGKADTPYHFYIRKSVPDHSHMLIVDAALIHIQNFAAFHAREGCHHSCSVILHFDFSEINIFGIQGHRFSVKAETVGEMSPGESLLKAGYRIPGKR